jgi:hypothetical protein|tara:strand:- start:847 stop:972 length:126 start_codon:yes stop_codon:yes gene_type:complete
MFINKPDRREFIQLAGTGLGVAALPMSLTAGASSGETENTR